MHSYPSVRHPMFCFPGNKWQVRSFLQGSRCKKIDTNRTRTLRVAHLDTCCMQKRMWNKLITLPHSTPPPRWMTDSWVWRAPVSVHHLTPRGWLHLSYATLAYWQLSMCASVCACEKESWIWECERMQHGGRSLSPGSSPNLSGASHLKS